MSSSWESIGRSVAGVAPLLASALGGPVGAVAGAAGALLGSFLGVDPTPEAISKQLDPQTLVRVRELEARQQERLLEWQATQLHAQLENTVSARDREVALARAGHGASWSTSIVASIVTLGFFVMLGLVLVRGEALIGQAGLLLLGTLGAAFGTVINYFLGSSSGSLAKDNRLALRDVKDKP